MVPVVGGRQPREHRSWVTVSWVATASYTGVESSTRALSDITPAYLAVFFVSSNSLFGRADARRRLRMPTSRVGWNAS